MKKKYSREMYEFVRDNIKGTRYYEMAQMIKDKFGIEISESAMHSYCTNHKLRNGLFHKPEGIRTRKLTTPEMDEFILANNHMRPAKELAQMVNEKFGTSLTPEQIKAYRSRNKLDSGLTGYFPKGHVSHNKGKKMSPEVYEKAKSTMFKKGQRPHNTHPVGTEIQDAKDHYTYVKIAEPNVWKQKHHIIWEEHNGPIPEGMIITFLDGDNTNIEISNLAMVSRSEHAIMTTHKLRSKNPELTKAGINVAKLNDLMNKLKKKGKKK